MSDIDILKNNGVNLAAGLKYLGDIETYNETLQDFLGYINEKVNDLKKYKDAGDTANYSIIAHSIKSDAKYLGFMTLADYALSHEFEGKGGNLKYITEHFDELLNEINNVIYISMTYLRNAPAVKKEVKKDKVEEAEMVKEVKPTEVVADNTQDSILIVDDSDMVLNFISKLFKNQFNCILASDGRKAIQEISKDNNIKGILLDLNMPGVNGFEVLDYLKNNDLLAKYPVSIITGADDKDTIQRAFTYQIVDMLQKPFNERDVQRIIERTINYGK